ncbi:MAG: hypothetical protein H2173_08300 [Opitutus sp.]|jgi:hypothetical protein|nr:hypothetical protein [Opitutus sp.]MCS6274149.1 hypothetical protein [Opitutus sp.]
MSNPFQVNAFFAPLRPKVLLRCTMIPDLNEQDEPLVAIAEMERRDPSLAVIETISWHMMGKSKNAWLERPVARG